ncbi:MAG: hypothetical protein COS94_01500 [Candidatus Hydrogenedentes bacterium CG07_land_8_20_14_0_80_42_17]|nr:MAG: hypothetical protein AUJ18_10975 [Candidatus Hydrogenedentes bacterium CG1_02_42_14]PIU48569.1 MAG: hypothetical protein COS94_01500 [Candidatus Hydrogenedentes bacterium CG07_land_8_20_14_0_80_42_17]
MKKAKTSRIVGVLILLLILFGLSLDFWRASRAKNDIELKVKKAVEEAAMYLPYRPHEAVQAGLSALESMKINSDPGSVTVTPDGYALKISIYSDVPSFFSWIIGFSKIRFKAEKEARIEVDGAAPCDEVSADQVLFGIVPEAPVSFDRDITIERGRDKSNRAFDISGKAMLKVGDKPVLKEIASFEKIALHDRTIAVILSRRGELEPEILGFGALEIIGTDSEGNLRARFIQSQVEGDPKVLLSKEHDFGLRRGGTPRAVIN